MRPTLLALTLLLAACTAAATPPASVAPSPPASPSAAGSTAPSAAPSSSAAAFPLTLTDDEGTEVELAAEPERLVSLTPAVTETLFALGVGDRIVGKGEDVFLYPPEASDIPDVSTFDSGVDIERVVSLEPDVVFAGGNFGTPPDAIERLRSLGVPVVVLYAPTVDAVFSDIELVGQAVGRADEAAAIVERMEAAFDETAEAVANEPKPRLFYELDATGAIYGPADRSFLAEMISLAGAQPITTGSPDKFDIAVERLIEADPEVILLADAAFGMTADQVAARPGWDVMTAVKEGDIRPIDDQTVTRPGPRLHLGLSLLAATIHPEAAVPSPEPIPPAP
jgi:iron complex transport system substrate-binding protein